MSLRILVVDDNQDICHMTATGLKKAGHFTETHLSAESALAALKIGTWDVVLTDMRMPGMDGLQFLKEIKLLNSDIAVMLITAHGSVDTAIEAMRLGAMDFILKPFDME